MHSTVMKSRIVLATCVYLLYISQCFASTGEASFDGGNYVANWTYNPDTDKISVQVEVKTTGWVGFGFAKTAPNNMRDYDVIVGGVKNAAGYLNDYYTGGKSRPPKDTQQDYNLTSSKEEGGKTTLTFERKRETGDNKDVQLKVGEGVFLIWAYHSSSEGDDPTNFPFHSEEGASAQKHVIIPQLNSTAVPMATSVAVAPSASVKPTTQPTPTSMANFIGSGALVNVVLALLFSFLYIHL